MKCGSAGAWHRRDASFGGPVGPSSNGLVPREWKVLGLLASGTRDKGGAVAVDFENAVKTHLYTIYRKLSVDCRLAAMLHYFQQVKSDGKYPQSLRRREKPRRRIPYIWLNTRTLHPNESGIWRNRTLKSIHHTGSERLESCASAYA